VTSQHLSSSISNPMKTTRLIDQTVLSRTLRQSLAIALVAGLVWNPTSASCARVKIEINATVSLVDDPDNLLHNAVALGDIITGIYSYDSFAVDSNPLPQVGDYYYITAPNGIRLNVNGLTFATDPRDVNFLLELVNDYQDSDNYVVISYNNFFSVSATGMFVMNIIDWQLDDPTQTALSSTALPRNAPILSNWQSIFGLSISSDGDNHFLIRANVTLAATRR